VDIGLLAEHRELLDRGGAAHVGRHHQRVPSLPHQPLRELAGRRRLARALKAEQENDARRRRVLRQAAFGVAEERQQLVADDLRDLLARGQALQDLLVRRLVPHAVDERLDDLEIDVSLEQREPDLAQRGLDVLFGQPDFAAQRLKGVLNAAAERFEHLCVRLQADRDPRRLPLARPPQRAQTLILGQFDRHWQPPAPV
jgi:hypothetical protein